LRRLWSFAPCALLSAPTLPQDKKAGAAHDANVDYHKPLIVKT